MGKLLLGILGFSGLFIENVESRRSRSACLNPDRSIGQAGVCSGNGDCHKSSRGPDWCECDRLDRDGFYNLTTGKRFLGKLCQCNPWNCINTDLLDGKVDFNYW